MQRGTLNSKNGDTFCGGSGIPWPPSCRPRRCAGTATEGAPCCNHCATAAHDRLCSLALCHSRCRGCPRQTECKPGRSCNKTTANTHTGQTFVSGSCLCLALHCSLLVQGHVAACYQYRFDLQGCCQLHCPRDFSHVLLFGMCQRPQNRAHPHLYLLMSSLPSASQRGISWLSVMLPITCTLSPRASNQ